jgi:hypothetical protein
VWVRRAEGGRGSIDLANAVIKVCDAAKQQPSTVKYLYPLDMPIKVCLVWVCVVLVCESCVCMRAVNAGLPSKSSGWG